MASPSLRLVASPPIISRLVTSKCVHSSITTNIYRSLQRNTDVGESMCFISARFLLVMFLFHFASATKDTLYKISQAFLYNGFLMNIGGGFSIVLKRRTTGVECLFGLSSGVQWRLVQPLTTRGTKTMILRDTKRVLRDSIIY
jgi:hypothetical protein